MDEGVLKTDEPRAHKIENDESHNKGYWFSFGVPIKTHMHTINASRGIQDRDLMVYST